MASNTEIEIDRVIAAREAGKISEKDADQLIEEIMDDHNQNVNSR